MEPPSFITLDVMWFVIALVFCGIFSFLETSITAIRLFRLKEMAQGTKRYKALFEDLEHNPNRVLITILIAYNLANVIAAFLSSQITENVARFFSLSEGIGFVIGIIIASTTILIADLIPKDIATQRSDHLFKSTLWMTNILYYAFYPFVTFLLKFTSYTTKLITPKEQESPAVPSEKEIQFLIEYINEKGLMEHHKTAMLKSIFRLSATMVKEVMVPENAIVAISLNSTKEEVLGSFSKYQFSRLPVYHNETDNIIGMIHQKDFFKSFLQEEFSVAAIMRSITFVPESTKVLHALKEFREQRIHIAIVLNEYGGISGLVTLEDLIEEIVGDISDEYEPFDQKIEPIASGEWLVDASIELEKLAPYLHIEFERHNALTLSGFLTEKFQSVPKQEALFPYKGYVFTIQQANSKRIMKVLIRQEIEQL